MAGDTQNIQIRQYDHVKLALFIDSSLLSSLVLKQITQLKQDLHISDEQVAIYNISTHIEKAIEWRIIACPTLVRFDINPLRCLIGDLQNMDMVLAFLDVDIEDR